VRRLLRGLRAFTALPASTLSGLAACIGLWQGLICCGIFIASEGAGVLAPVAGIGLLGSFGLALRFMLRTIGQIPPSSDDQRGLIGLALIAVCVAAAVIAAPESGEVPSELWAAAFAAAQAAPLIVLWARCAGESAYRSNVMLPHGSRFLSLTFVGMLVGGWAAGTAGLVYAAVDPFAFDLNGDYTTTPHERMVGGVIFAAQVQWVGIVLGFFGSVFAVGHLLLQTRLERSVPFVFAPLVAIGAGATLVDVIFAIPAVACGALMLACVANRCFRLPASWFRATERCMHCEYDLSGINAEVCPECGNRPACCESEPDHDGENL